MKRKSAMLLLCGLLFVTGCSGDIPELLDPVGEQEDSAKVTTGELYDMDVYDSTVTVDHVNVKVGVDSIVGEVKVKNGDQVTAGQVLISMDTQGVTSQVESVQSQIEKKEKENEYMNKLADYDIQVAQLELKMAQQTGDSKQVNEKETALRKLQSKLASDTVEQQKELAELQVDKMEGDVTQTDVTASDQGSIVYVGNYKAGDQIPAGTVVAVIAKDDSKKLFGDYIESSTIQSANQIYALIGEKQYTVTNVPYGQFELASRTFYDLPLFSTFYFEDAPEVATGMYATIVVISNYKESALQIPENALYSDVDGNYVYKKVDDEYKRVNVQIGEQTQTAIEITDGLEEGDEVYVRP